MSSRGLALVAVVFASACAATPPRDVSNASLSASDVIAVVNTNVVTEVVPSARVLDILREPDRLAADRALDEHKQGAELLTFLDVPADARVAELGCGGGYMTELLARAIGPRGTVYAQNPPLKDERAWNARLARPVNANVVRVERGFSAPLPDEARALDLVYLAVDYRALPSMGVDLDAMNHVVHLALRHGGRYVVLDRTPPEGQRTADLHALHTYESRNARREIEAAGFAFVAEGRFFRDARDPRDWDAVPDETRQGEKPDRFVLVFRRP